ncbi:DUF4031 domain-containing protein [Epidermidibacterium keratini]|uniref:DUF4031 domain-containing protein n=1 Tax=Epidermidibacterium keratini TaxID=1891644 RepID=A0A7L4YPY2_9ACTN|nr:DUF4031 domain-containing protein [Epidermidibacterium keratini]QHC01128.1 DUF4031 domain-containing protein [Epidermidibacterium keratini]
MTIYIDRPIWPGHGRVWSHLISSESVAELQEFADALGLPRRAFDRDHYDVPSERFETALEAGAVLATSQELVRHLYAAGLRPRPGTG